MENLTIGTQGWMHENWIGGFYAEDMPEDWFLDFYSNQFYCVLVESSEWLKWDEALLEEMSDALEDETFAIYLKLEATLTSGVKEKVLQIHEVLPEFLKGFLIFSSEKLVLPTELSALNVTYCSAQVVEDGWCWQHEDQMLSGAPLGWVDSLSSEGKEQVELLKSFMGSLPENTLGAPFIVASNPIEIQQVLNLKTVGELLGF